MTLPYRKFAAVALKGGGSVIQNFLVRFFGSFSKPHGKPLEMLSRVGVKPWLTLYKSLQYSTPAKYILKEVWKNFELFFLTVSLIQNDFLFLKPPWEKSFVAIFSFCFMLDVFRLWICLQMVMESLIYFRFFLIPQSGLLIKSVKLNFLKCVT